MTGTHYGSCLPAEFQHAWLEIFSGLSSEDLSNTLTACELAKVSGAWLDRDLVIYESAH